MQIQQNYDNIQLKHKVNEFVMTHVFCDQIHSSNSFVSVELELGVIQ